MQSRVYIYAFLSISLSRTAKDIEFLWECVGIIVNESVLSFSLCALYSLQEHFESEELCQGGSGTVPESGYRYGFG